MAEKDLIIIILEVNKYFLSWGFNQYLFPTFTTLLVKMISCYQQTGPTLRFPQGGAQQHHQD